MKKTLSILTYALLLSLPLSVLAQVTIINPISSNNFSDFLVKIADGVAAVVGSLAIIMFIISGIMFLLSAGSPERINQAKGCVTYAIIGIVIAISAKGLATFMTSTLGVK